MLMKATSTDKTAPDPSDEELLADCLIPGSSATIPSTGFFAGAACSLAASLRAISPPDRVRLIRQFEAENPEAFRRAYRDLIAAYYSDPRTRAQLATLGAEGPLPASSRFDEGQLSHVITEQRGKSRL
jgi:hypothetical protein